MAFVTLSLLELIHSFNIRSEESIFKIGLLKNMYLISAVAVGIILQVAVILIPQVATIFDVVQLNNAQWIYTICISISPIFIVEAQKALNSIKFKLQFTSKKLKINQHKNSCQNCKHNV